MQQRRRRAAASRVDNPNYRPRYRRHRSGQARVTIDGRDFYLGRYGTLESHEAYDHLIQRWLAEGRRLEDVAAHDVVRNGSGEEPVTVLELLAHYWTMLKEDGHVPRKDAQSHPRALAFRWAVQPLRDLYPATPAADFGPRALRKVRVVMIEQGLSRSTINARINLIRRVFRWGASMELIPVDVYHALVTLEPIKRGQFPELDSAPVEPVPEADVFAVLAHLPRQVATMVQLQWLTAMRPGEVCAMRVGEIDQDGPEENGIQLWLYHPTHHKTEHHGRVRVIPLGSRCQELMRPFLRADAGAYLFSPSEAEAERNARRRAQRRTPRWPSHEREQRRKREESPDRRLTECYDVHAYRRAIERACRKAGVKPWSPNRLRHSAATRIRQVHGIEAARVLLGHVSSATTEIYAQMDQQQAIRIMAAEG